MNKEQYMFRAKLLKEKMVSNKIEALINHQKNKQYRGSKK